jgi:sphingomyelin phosphodiesterase 2
MDIIRDHAGLTDAWTVTHRTATSASSSSLVSSPSAGTVVLSAADEAIRRYGVTADSPLNSYSTRKALDSHARQYLGKRLDYVFYRQAIRPSSDEPTTLFLKATKTAVVFTERVPEYDFSFSDHFALECTFEIQETQSHTTPWTKRGTSLSSSTISNSIEALTACYRFSRSRARRELTICFLCILLLIGLVVGSAWIPATSINPVFVLITIFLAWLATTMLYEGFIFGRWEQNALTTVIEELEIHKKTGEMFRPPGRRTQT